MAPPRTPAFVPRPRPFRPIELVAGLAVAAVVDLALWTRGGIAAGGLGLALLFTALPVALFVAARAWRGSPRLGLVTALLALVVLRCVYDPTPSVVLVGASLIGAFALALRARRVFVPEAIGSWVAAFGKLPSRIGAAARGLGVLASRTKLGAVSPLPIVIPAGLVALFLGVFALANPVVAHGLGAAWAMVTNVIALPSIGRVLLWTFALTVSASLLRPACRLARGSEAATIGQDASPTSLLVTRNAFAGLNVLFLGYNAIDATYLWTGSPPSGMHTQQYAHQGAFWLTVALLMLTAVIGVSFRGALAYDPRAKTSRALAFAWILQGLVLGLGTYRRIAIHIAKSGLSDLRIVGILGTTLVLSGVVLVALKLRWGKTFMWLLRRQLDAFALTAVLYAVAPTHMISARVNVARVSRGEYRPLLHAFRQSHEKESAAALLPLLDHSDLRVRQGVAALLADEHDKLRTQARGRGSWREQDIASRRALALLNAAAPRIEAELGEASPSDARQVLLQISRVANQDASLEELLAIPAASDVQPNRYVQ